ncbi:MAG TPA: glycosyltransferase, partial [Myxococcales bacterium]|nr:glycosyltransferase [Myxococcales bacterium]
MRSALHRVAVAGEMDLALAEALRAQGFRVERIDATSVVSVARDLMRVRPAVVHARAAYLKVSLVSRLLDVPVVVEAGGGDVNAATARAARGAERTVCPTTAIREGLIQHGAPGSSITILRGLLDPARDLGGTQVFPPVLDPRLRWIVCAAPCDSVDRGHADLLLAFLSLARTRPQLRLLVSGAGPLARAIASESQHAGMQARVVVHALTDDQLPGVMTRAAAVVCPSRSATHPDALPEALAVGAPVVASAIGHHPSWIREGRTGWLV